MNTGGFIIWHLSDLHFPNQMTYEDRKPPHTVSKRNLTELLGDFYEHNKDKYQPDLVIVTGDLVLDGKAYSTRAVTNQLSGLFDRLEQIVQQEKRIVVVPGNHDVDRYVAFNDRFKGFRNFLQKRKYEYITDLEEVLYLENVGLFFYCFNSCQELGGIQCGLPERLVEALKKNKSINEDIINEVSRNAYKALSRDNIIDGGYISETYEDIQKVLKRTVKRKELDNKTLGIAVLHHHITPHMNWKDLKPYDMVSNAGMFAGCLSKLGFVLVIHGHKHGTFRSNVELEDPFDESRFCRMQAVCGGVLDKDWNPKSFNIIRLLRWNEKYEFRENELIPVKFDDNQGLFTAASSERTSYLDINSQQVFHRLLNRGFKASGGRQVGILGIEKAFVKTIQSPAGQIVNNLLKVSRAEEIGYITKVLGHVVLRDINSVLLSYTPRGNSLREYAESIFDDLLDGCKKSEGKIRGEVINTSIADIEYYLKKPTSDEFEKLARTAISKNYNVLNLFIISLGNYVAKEEQNENAVFLEDIFKKDKNSLQSIYETRKKTFATYKNLFDMRVAYVTPQRYFPMNQNGCLVQAAKVHPLDCAIIIARTQVGEEFRGMGAGEIKLGGSLENFPHIIVRHDFAVKDFISNFRKAFKSYAVSPDSDEFTNLKPDSQVIKQVAIEMQD